MSDEHTKISEGEPAEFDPLQIGVSKQQLIAQLQDTMHSLQRSIDENELLRGELEKHKRALDVRFILEKKDTNPKDAIGISKAPISTIPSGVLMELGVAMLEGALKYGRHNYRVAGVRASVYYDALARHMMDWWEGMDDDEASGLSHIIKAIATLAVLRDAQMCDMIVDDRPPSKLPPDWLIHLNLRVKALLEKYPEPVKPYTEKGQKELDDAGPKLETKPTIYPA